jgi:hypothetical protein
MLNIFSPELHPLLVYFYCFIKKNNNTKNIDDFSLLIQKKTLQ